MSAEAQLDKRENIRLALPQAASVGAHAVADTAEQNGYPRTNLDDGFPADNSAGTDAPAYLYFGRLIDPINNRCWYNHSRVLPRWIRENATRTDPNASLEMASNAPNALLARAFFVRKDERPGAQAPFVVTTGAFIAPTTNLVGSA